MSTNKYIEFSKFDSILDFKNSLLYGKEIEFIYKGTDYVVSLSDKKEIKLAPDLSPVVLEMERLGNNLNQIAMKLNSGVVYTPDFKSVLDNQKVIYEMIYKLSEKN